MRALSATLYFQCWAQSVTLLSSAVLLALESRSHTLFKYMLVERAEGHPFPAQLSFENHVLNLVRCQLFELRVVVSAVRSRWTQIFLPFSFKVLLYVEINFERQSFAILMSCVVQVWFYFFQSHDNFERVAFGEPKFWLNWKELKILPNLNGCLNCESYVSWHCSCELWRWGRGAISLLFALEWEYY